MTTVVTTVVTAVLMAAMLAILILGGVFQLASCNGSSNHAQNRVTAHLLPCIASCYAPTDGAHDAALTFRSVWVVGRIRVMWRCVGVLVILLMLRIVGVLTV